MSKTRRASYDCTFVVQLVAVGVLLALLTNFSAGDYADNVCKKVLRGTVFGIANVTATDGNILPIRYECNSTPYIQTCSLAARPNAKVAASTTGVVRADVGARFYTITCRNGVKPTIEPVEFLAKLCTDDVVAKEENLKSTDEQAPSDTPASKEVLDVVEMPETGPNLNVSYTVSCFDKPGIISCSFAGGNRLRSSVAIAQGNSAYIVQDGTDYSLTCKKLAPASISSVKKTYADELCKETVSSAWEQTVKSDYSTYPTEDQLVLNKEDTQTVGKSSIAIAFQVQCFSEPVQIQQCSYAGGGRLKDNFTVPPGSNGAYIRQGGQEFTLKCDKFTKAKISAKESTGADTFCEDSILAKEKERKDTGASFSLNEKEETTKVLSLERPTSIGTKIKVEVKAMCFGDRPIFKSCRMNRKGSKAVSAGYYGVCVNVSIGGPLVKHMTRLDCDEFRKPRFLTKGQTTC